VATIDYIARVAQRLVSKYQTRNPYEICGSLGIHVSLKDLEGKVKAYYCCHARVRSIVLHEHVSETDRRVLVAHELGHDRLHKDMALLNGFKETELFNDAIPSEYEANLFAAELLIGDDELLEMLSDDKPFFAVASELCIPQDLLDFKLRALKHKGYDINIQYIANGKTWKEGLNCLNAEDGC